MTLGSSVEQRGLEILLNPVAEACGHTLSRFRERNVDQQAGTVTRFSDLPLEITDDLGS